jgi:hypothetical protein
VWHSDNNPDPFSVPVGRLSRPWGANIRPIEGPDQTIDRIKGLGSVQTGAARRLRQEKGRSDGRCGLGREPVVAPGYLSSSPPVDDGLEPQDGAEFDVAGLGEAQLGAAGAGAGAGAGAATGAAGFGAAGLGARGLGAGGVAAGAAFFAGAFLALAFLADFFGAAAFDFLADFFADFLAFFADFLADFFEDFFADFVFAVRSFFLLFLFFLPPFFFLPLAIVILLLPPINVYRAFQVVRFKRGANRSVQSWPGTTRRPIEKLNRVHHRN